MAVPVPAAAVYEDTGLSSVILLYSTHIAGTSADSSLLLFLQQKYSALIVTQLPGIFRRNTQIYSVAAYRQKKREGGGDSELKPHL